MATVIHKELLYHICEVLGGRDQIGMIYCAFSLQLVIFMYSGKYSAYHLLLERKAITLRV